MEYGVWSYFICIDGFWMDRSKRREMMIEYYNYNFVIIIVGSKEATKQAADILNNVGLTH